MPKTIVTVCARGGSQGLPGKNIRRLMGKPLIAWTIEQAFASCLASEVLVSTDDPEIAAVAMEWGARVPFLRPPELATATAPKLPVLVHLLDWADANGMSVDRIIDLDPTSPLRAVADIHACARLLDEDTDVVITGYESGKNPYFNMVESKEDGFFGRVCQPAQEAPGRQLAPRVYAMNASIYAWHRRTLTNSLWDHRRIKLHPMPRERSIDIDDAIDFDLVEILMKRRSMS